MYLNKIKLIPLIFLLLTQVSNAGLLSLNIDATDYADQTSIYDWDSNTYSDSDINYTSISPVNFDIQYNINFDAPLLFDSVIEWDENGKHYSASYKSFDIQRLTATTPFTDELQSTFPKKELSPYTSNTYSPRLRFNTRVVSDIATGKIIQEESYENYILIDGYGFQNKAYSTYYEHILQIWFKLPTIYTSSKANVYDTSEIKDMLVNRQDIKVRYNESKMIGKRDNNQSTFYKFAYVGDGTHTYKVPEPNLLAIFIAIIIYFLFRLKNYTKI